MMYFNFVRGRNLVTEEALEITHPLYRLQNLAKTVLRNIETTDKTLINAMKTAAVPSMAIWNTFVPMLYYSEICREYADKFTNINATDLDRIYYYIICPDYKKEQLVCNQTFYSHRLDKLQSEFHFLLDMGTAAGREAFNQLVRRDQKRKELYAEFNLAANELVKLVIEYVLGQYYWRA